MLYAELDAEVQEAIEGPSAMFPIVSLPTVVGVQEVFGTVVSHLANAKGVNLINGYWAKVCPNAMMDNQSRVLP